jgi:hypothetical protein
MNQNAISRLERPDYGKATLTTLRRLAAAMDVALIVRFVPFSELVDWISGTPRVNRGLSAGSLGVLDYGKEEAAGLFAVAVSGAASRGAAAVTRGSEFRIVVDDVGPVQRVLFRPALKDVSIDVPFTDGASTSHTVRSSQSVAK